MIVSDHLSCKAKGGSGWLRKESLTYIRVFIEHLKKIFTVYII